MTTLTDEEIAAAQALMRQVAKMWQAFIAQVREALKPLLSLMARLNAWIARQGPCSPALAYATPAMRRHAARDRARLATQARHRRYRCD